MSSKLEKVTKALENGNRKKFLHSFEKDISQFKKLKNEYNTIDTENLEIKTILFLLSISLAHKDLKYSYRLISLHNIKSIDTLFAKLLLGIFYYETYDHKHSIEYLLPIFQKNTHILKESTLFKLNESLLKTGMFTALNSSLDFSLNKYRDSRYYRFQALEYQIIQCNLSPTEVKKQNIIDNLNYMAGTIKTPHDYLMISKPFFMAGYFQQSVNMYNIYFKTMQINTTPPPTEQNLFNTTNAIESINSIIDILHQNNIIAFPAFGSLLGLVRDGKLFDHDKDADLGIFVESYDEIYTIVSTLCTQDRFISYDMVTTPKESHVWNIPILDTQNSILTDLFFFYKKETHYETGIYTKCSTLRWIFTPFNLVSKKLGEREYMIPHNYEQHLEELYGEWRETVVVWNSLLNCPNLSKDSQKVVTYFALDQLYLAIKSKNLKKFDNIYNTLRDRWSFRFSKETDDNLMNIRKKLVKLEE